MLLVYYNVICLPYGGDPSLRGVIGSGKFHTLLHCCKSHLQKKNSKILYLKFLNARVYWRFFYETFLRGDRVSNDIPKN